MALTKVLREWLPSQRWFRGERAGAVRVLDVLSWPGEDVDIETYLLDVDGVVYQVPVTLRSTALADVEPLGTLAGRFVYDGPHDGGYVAALASRLGIPAGSAARVLRGEQSNTSIVTGDAIVKVFRVLAPGDNPDVAVLSALTAAGVLAVPRFLGAITGGPDDSHLAVACEFIADGADGWREALTAAATAGAFGATELGQATAAIHASLRAAFPTAPPDAATLRRSLLARLAWASHIVPALDEARIRASIDGFDLSRLPAAQRIHGDFHLGQVLDSPSRGWIILDFEGEPLRPIAERTAPDYPLRDVVGMARSFDYAAGHVALFTPERADAARRWAQEATTAFLAGYGGVDHPDLYRALWLDKALYEAAYEQLNRPDWLPIPLAAIARIVES